MHESSTASDISETILFVYGRLPSVVPSGNCPSRNPVPPHRRQHKDVHLENAFPFALKHPHNHPASPRDADQSSDKESPRTTWTSA